MGELRERRVLRRIDRGSVWRSAPLRRGTWLLAAAFLAAVQLDVDIISQMTYALVVERRTPGAFAAEWVRDAFGAVGFTDLELAMTADGRSTSSPFLRHGLAVTTTQKDEPRRPLLWNALTSWAVWRS